MMYILVSLQSPSATHGRTFDQVWRRFDVETLSHLLKVFVWLRMASRDTRSVVQQ